MLFNADVFSPELVPDPRVRAVLTTVVENGAGFIRPSDILAASIRQGDEQILATLVRASRRGFSAHDLARLAEVNAAAGVAVGGPVTVRDRSGFTPPALAALDEFDVALRRTETNFHNAALEALLACVLKHLDRSERRAWSPLDVDRAVGMLGRVIAEGAKTEVSVGQSVEGEEKVSGEDIERSDEPFVLPPEIALSHDLTQDASTGEMPAAVPFDGEPQYERLFDMVARTLHRRKCNHVLLIGERGVGKSTILAELARRAAGRALPFLQSKRFLLVDCRYVAPDESRLRLAAILDHVSNRPDLIVCIDGFARLLKSECGGGNKAVLLSMLTRCRCSAIGLMTPHEFEELVADDADMLEFFQRVDVEEPEPKVALKLLRHYAAGLNQKFGVTIDDVAVQRAVTLSANYILNDQLPAKALNILHRVCEDIDYERLQHRSRRDRVTEGDVVEVVSQLSGVPQETLRGIAEKRDYERSLSEHIVGQDHVVREVAAELGLVKAGLTDPHKPASVMLFVGQTGTGKTEMAKVIARFYSTSKRLRTYTLGNFVEPHSVSGIIGVPAGYVGHDQGGRLVNDLNSDPYCVFLLDEADKAHPDVLQPFLNLFDEGWVRDQRGTMAYANKAIFILTTNVGQRMIADLARKGTGMDGITERIKGALSEIKHTKSNRPVFAPEFLARIRRIIVFQPLDRDAMEGICRNLVRDMQQSWQEKREKRLDIPGQLILQIAESAHRQNTKSKGREGGRIVHKLIREWIEVPIQRAASTRPDEYQACEAVSLDLTRATEALSGHNPLELVSVCFEGGD